MCRWIADEHERMWSESRKILHPDYHESNEWYTRNLSKIVAIIKYLLSKPNNDEK